MPSEDTGYTAGERIAGFIGLAVVAVLALVMLDLATGGRLAALADRGTAPDGGTGGTDE